MSAIMFCFTAVWATLRRKMMRSPTNARYYEFQLNCVTFREEVGLVLLSYSTQTYTYLSEFPVEVEVNILQLSNPFWYRFVYIIRIQQSSFYLYSSEKQSSFNKNDIISYARLILYTYSATNFWSLPLSVLSGSPYFERVPHSSGSFGWIALMNLATRIFCFSVHLAQADRVPSGIHSGYTKTFEQVKDIITRSWSVTQKRWAWKCFGFYNNKDWGLLLLIWVVHRSTSSQDQKKTNISGAFYTHADVI